jgi:hypothetical protein
VVSPYLTVNTLRLRYRAQLVMLCGETAAVCCENRTEHTDTLWAVRTIQETRYFSATEPIWLCCVGKQPLFAVRTVRNTQIQSGLVSGQDTGWSSEQVWTHCLSLDSNRSPLYHPSSFPATILRKLWRPSCKYHNNLERGTLSYLKRLF